jgi:hypothetical protein
LPAEDEHILTNDIVELASRYGRYGYRRITALLQRRGWSVNHKRGEDLATGRAESARQATQKSTTVAQ